MSDNFIELRNPSFNFYTEAVQLENLKLRNISLRSLEELDLTRSTLLQYLDLSYNEIDKIPGNYFSFCHQKLKTLIMSNNKISFIQQETLSVLRSLTQLDLSNNYLKTISRKHLYHMLPETFVLRLNSNCLASVSFPKKALFKSLFLSGNNLTQLSDENGFNIARASELYDLSNNFIGELREQQFSNFNKGLKILNLRNNSLSLIERNTFARLKMLAELDLSFNNFSDLFEDTFSGMVSLSVLDLSNNKLKKISKNLFKDLTNIKNLSLNGNRIKYIEENSFVNLRFLKNLYLYENPIEYLFFNQTLAGLNSISSIYVPNQIFINKQILNILIASLEARKFKEIQIKKNTNLVYYEAIFIFFYPNAKNSDAYSHEQCFQITCLVRNGIFLNLGEDDLIKKYITDCNNWSKQFYQNVKFIG